VVVGRRADRLFNIAGERCARDGFGLLPDGAGRPAIERAIAHEGELTNAPVVLIDDAADRLREGRVPHAVEHDLRNRAAAVDGLEPRFIIDRLRQA
jgi:hypothetical protein